MDEVPEIRRFRFGVFEFDGHTLELVKNGRLVAVRPQPLKLLALLLARPGELVPRTELQRTLWDGDTFVDFEQGVNHAIRELRAALGDAAESPRFIQTLPRRGYRFIAPVERVSPPLVISSVDLRLGAADSPLEVPATVRPAANRQDAVWWRRWTFVAPASLVVALAIIGAAYLAFRLENAGQPSLAPRRNWAEPLRGASGRGLTCQAARFLRTGAT